MNYIIIFSRPPKAMDPKERWNVPDRITGYSALKELNPRRKWNFIEVRITVTFIISF